MAMMCKQDHGRRNVKHRKRHQAKVNKKKKKKRERGNIVYIKEKKCASNFLYSKIIPILVKKSVIFLILSTVL